MDNWKTVKNSLASLIGPLTADNLNLTEDLFQATNASYAIDCGWYSNQGDAEKGFFATYLIYQCNWEQPVLRLQTYTLKDAEWSIHVFMEYCKANSLV